MKRITRRLWTTEEYHYPGAYGYIPRLDGYLHEDDESRPCIIVAPGGAYLKSDRYLVNFPPSKKLTGYSLPLWEKSGLESESSLEIRLPASGDRNTVSCSTVKKGALPTEYRISGRAAGSVSGFEEYRRAVVWHWKDGGKVLRWNGFCHYDCDCEDAGR